MLYNYSLLYFVTEFSVRSKNRFKKFLYARSWIYTKNHVMCLGKSFLTELVLKILSLLHSPDTFSWFLIVSQRNHKTGQEQLKASVEELAARAAFLAKAEAAKNITPPNSAYQFEVSWRGLSGDRTLQAQLLKV